MKIDIKTTVHAIGSIKDGCIKIPRDTIYDGEEQRFDTLDLKRAIRGLDIPDGEYKMTITLEKI